MRKRHPDKLCGGTSGEDSLRAAIARRRRKRSDARSDDPTPYDESWGWWVEERLARLENGQTWLIRVAIMALTAEITRVALAAAADVKPLDRDGLRSLRPEEAGACPNHTVFAPAFCLPSARGTPPPSVTLARGRSWPKAAGRWTGES